ncbi:response regulator transcription factor [Paenibacillus eucommiae]|uniref:Two-component system response regulator YesN n=1 Tax=Paenibacillus eucommiae TaxID=1355755 RepID=A0ABS4IT03_9BACL|nr:response regulator [Paenibacillus eucommiae]MBP1990658.1 two-component system response regulator YesN [Paenibacillus eucommiae]
MYSVMLVDDEHVLREGMRKFVPWEPYKVTTIFEASCVSEALEVLSHNAVDLIFLDIKMPGESGLDLLKHLYEHKSEAHVVMISGYDTFDYAQISIRYQAMDYLLKPIKIEDIKRILDGFCEKKALLAQNKADEKKLMNELFAADFFKWMNGMYDEEWYRKLLSKFSQCYEDMSFRIMYISSPPTISSKGASINEHNKSILTEQLLTLPHAEAVIALEERSLSYMLIFVSQKEENTKEQLLELASSLFALLPVDSILFGEAFKNERIGSCLSLASLNGLKQQMFYSSEPIIFANEETSTVVKEFIMEEGLAKEFAKEIEKAFHMNDGVKINQNLLKMYQYVKNKHAYDMQSVRNEYIAFVQSLYAELAELPCEVEEMMDATSLKLLHETVVRQLGVLFEHAELKMKSTAHKMIKDIKKYVDMHISEPISLIELAEMFRASSEYLSHLFKKEEGINFSQYLKQTRINKAKEIMKQNVHLKIYEVAYQVGYNDAKHFSKVFREMTNLTPAQYWDRV